MRTKTKHVRKKATKKTGSEHKTRKTSRLTPAGTITGRISSRGPFKTLKDLAGEYGYITTGNEVRAGDVMHFSVIDENKPVEQLTRKELIAKVKNLQAANEQQRKDYQMMNDNHATYRDELVRQHGIKIDAIKLANATDNLRKMDTINLQLLDVMKTQASNPIRINNTQA